MRIIRNLINKGPESGSGPELDPRTLARYRAEVIRYLARNFRSQPQDIDDLCQEVYLQLLKRNDLSGIRKPLAFIYGVAAHVLADHHAATAAEHEKVVPEEDADPTSEGFVSKSLPAEDLLSIQQQIDSALAMLPPMQAAVLLAHKRDGLSYKEVADKLGLKVDTVHKYLTQARLKIRTHRHRK